jgi:hypothetical protein
MRLRKTGNWKVGLISVYIIKKFVGLSINSPIRLHGRVFNWLSTGTTLHFYICIKLTLIYIYIYNLFFKILLLVMRKIFGFKGEEVTEGWKKIV